MPDALILGIDPGLVKTGWGLIRAGGGNRLQYISCGVIKPIATLPLAQRLLHLGREVGRVIAQHQPSCAAIEQTFVTANGASTLKLGQARGAILFALANAGLDVGEYAATLVKQSVTGTGRGEKEQVAMMIGTLLPAAKPDLATLSFDACDALAVAICHASHMNSPVGARDDRKTARPR